MAVAGGLGHHRIIVPVPVLTPRLSSFWLQLMTSVDMETARNLVDSMTNTVVVHERRLEKLTGIEPRPFATAVREALADRAERTRPRGEPAAHAAMVCRTGARRRRRGAEHRSAAASREHRVPGARCGPRVGVVESGDRLRAERQPRALRTRRRSRARRARRRGDVRRVRRRAGHRPAHRLARRADPAHPRQGRRRSGGPRRRGRADQRGGRGAVLPRRADRRARRRRACAATCSRSSRTSSSPASSATRP